MSTVVPASFLHGSLRDDSVRVWFAARKSKCIFCPMETLGRYGGSNLKTVPFMRPTVTVATASVVVLVEDVEGAVTTVVEVALFK